MEASRDRGERDAEIETCLLSGNPRNQHVNTPPIPSRASSFIQRYFWKFGDNSQAGKQIHVTANEIFTEVLNQRMLRISPHHTFM